MQNRESLILIIPSGQTTGYRDLNEGVLGWLEMPAAIDGTTLTIKSKGHDDDRMKDVPPEHGSHNIAADRVIALEPSFWAFSRGVEITMGAAQAAERRIALIKRPIA